MDNITNSSNMEYNTFGNERNTTRNGTYLNIHGWGSVLHHQLDISYKIAIVNWINKLGKRNLLMWMCFLIFVCITQLCILISTHKMQEYKMWTLREYLQKGPERLEELLEKRSYLAHDRDLLELQEYIRNDQDSLLPHQHEWVYVSSHPKDKYTYDDSKLSVPVKRLNVTNTNKFKCNENKNYNFSDLMLCNSRTVNPFLVVATTMHPTRKDKMFIFKNSINMWSDFHPNDVLPVMYISSVEDFRDDLYLLEYACSKGWMVLLTPKCNNNGVPVFNAMVHTLVLQFPKAPWHGYVNGDMLFDQSLISTLKFLTTASKYTPISMAVGRRYTIEIPQDYEIKNQDQYEKIFFNNSPSLDDSSAVDYFFTPTGRYDWRKVPPFIIGRTLFDSWLIYDSIVRNRKIIDMTESIRAGHQYNKDQSRFMNGHESATVDTDYNYNIIKNNNIRLNLSMCQTSCTPLKTMLVEQQKVRWYKRTVKNQVQWIRENMGDAWSETDTLNKIGDPFYPRVHTIPHNTSVYVEAIARRYGVFEDDEVVRRKRKLFEKYPTLGIKPDMSRFFKICRNHGANTRRQLTILSIVNKIPATEWKRWFRQ